MGTLVPANTGVPPMTCGSRDMTRVSMRITYFTLLLSIAPVPSLASPRKLREQTGEKGSTMRMGCRCRRRMLDSRGTGRRGNEPQRNFQHASICPELTSLKKSCRCSYMMKEYSLLR
jgi:hypothetical protein